MEDSFNKDLSSEFEFVTSRSSGPGGQNVNKVNTKVELRFSVFSSKILSEEEKQTIFVKLYHRINKQGILSVVAQSERSQLRNKEIAIEKFYKWLKIAFQVQKERKKTRPSKASKEKRLSDKQNRAQTKQNRRKPEW